MIMEVDKSQDLQLASWRPKWADGIVPVWMQAHLERADVSVCI